MQDTLQNHKSTISVGSREISKLGFADDIDLIAGSNLPYLTRSSLLGSF